MAELETLEGTVDTGLWYHYDASEDVLYLRLPSHRYRPVVGEETEAGILMRDDETDELVGLTIVNWWKRFGDGPLPESYRELAARIEPFGQKLESAA